MEVKGKAQWRLEAGRKARVGISGLSSEKKKMKLMTKKRVIKKVSNVINNQQSDIIVRED